MIKYVIKNKHTGVVYYKTYSFEQIEQGGLKELFDVENYEIIERLRFTGLCDKNGKRIFEGDKFDSEEDDGSYYAVEWSDYYSGFIVNYYSYAVSFGEGSQEIVDTEITLVDKNIFDVIDLVDLKRV